MPAERLQKILARAGLGSRRACEEFITAGRVTVNNQVAVLGQKADPAIDTIKVDGRHVEAPEALAYIAIYKPRGVISSLKGEGSFKTVRDLIELPGRLYPVGRLDVDSEGLILLTNDGELANQLTHPKYGHEKEYKVLVASWPDEEQLAAWRRGVVLEDGYRTQPAEVRIVSRFGKGTWLRIVMKEGRKRQIREIGSQLGLPVVRIIRVRIFSLRLGNLKPAEWRLLTPDEVAVLKGQKAPISQPKKPATRSPRKETTSKERKNRKTSRPMPTLEKGRHR